jgi:ethanolamine utilization cobalamin adenosyltransferase
MINQKTKRVVLSIAIPPCSNKLRVLATETKTEAPVFVKVEYVISKGGILSATLLNTISYPLYSYE